MSIISISMPDGVKQFVDMQAVSNGYNASDYILHLIGNEQKKQAEDHLAKLLKEGLDSGNPIEVDSEYWINKRKFLLAEGQKY